MKAFVIDGVLHSQYRRNWVVPCLQHSGVAFQQLHLIVITIFVLLQIKADWQSTTFVRIGDF